jgi:hypothetical protein
MSQLKFPFKFRTCPGGEVYTASLVSEDMVRVEQLSHLQHSCTYDKAVVLNQIANGDWKLVEPPNGVDKDGNPMFFSAEDLKPFQRVETRGYGMYIVVPNVQRGEWRYDEFVLCKSDAGGGWLEFELTQDEDYNKDLEVVAVYAPPTYNAEMLSANQYGPLVWQVKDFSAEKAAERKKIEDEIDKLQGQIEALSAKRALI